MQYLGYLLVLIHIFLLLWATGGMVELLSPQVPWPPYTNHDFPKWLLPIHWGSVIIASTGFLIGYFTAWSKTPSFLLAAYTMLFTICVIETLGFMTSPTRYYAMTAELVTYTAILLIVFRHPYFKRLFQSPPTITGRK
ncbi:MAG: hypothetical protein KF725_13325 [Cyclobacteriaceae bacterium]|nr:hypothetical protein [Cyclobacteriaceae bacterium]UYN85396.1 MAG: hypothetical protein KIT51_10890 [Cyclobacteriaceae bacterium]